MKNNIAETATTIGLVILAIMLLNPFHIWMPNMMVIGFLALLVAVIGIFATLVLRETSGDERDTAHRALAGRNAFLIGAIVITIGIIAQSFHHQVDPWLVIALTAMTVGKIITRMWSDRNL